MAELSEEELGAYFALTTAGGLVQRAVTAQLREHGLTPVQFAILARLSSAPDGLRMGEVADALVMSRAGTTYQVTQLEARGLLAREGSSDDERGVVARLSPAGHELIARTLPGHIALVRESLVDLLSRDELATLRAALERVVAKLRS